MHDRAPCFEDTSAPEEGQVHHDEQGHHLRTAEAHEVDGSTRRAAGRQDVVDDDHPMPGAHFILMQLQRGAAVLELIFAGMDESGQLAGFRIVMNPAPRWCASAAP